MATQRRIVLYRADFRAADDELLDRISAATGLDPQALASQLKKSPAVYLPPLEEGAAGELTALLEARGVDFDVDPFPTPPEQVAWLEGEIPKWVKRGFLPVYQLPALYWSYGREAPATGAAASTAPAARRAGARDPGFLVKAVLTIGAVLVGLGLILFVASNWQRIPAPAKIGGALALTLVALHAGYQLRFVRGLPKLGSTFLVIALFGIGGVVTLIAQIYHVLADDYLLPLVWGALCVPVALLPRFGIALYFASALWLWSYWAYPASHDQLPWYYAVLLLGFLVPYAIAVKDEVFYWAHVGALLLALGSTPATGDFWLCTVWVAALAVLAALAARGRLPMPPRPALYDWLLTAGFLVWGITFVQKFEDLPIVFYALPLAYFVYRARERTDNWFLVATVANALVWWLVIVVQVLERFDLGTPSATGIVLWWLATGVLVFGLGERLAGADWRIASILLRAGGALLTLVLVYAMSFRFYERESGFFESSTLLGIALASFAVGAALVARGGRQGRPRRDVLVLLALLAVALGLAAATSPALGLHVVTFNLILFATAMALMLAGHREQSLLWYNLGIGLFVVLIVSRYFDTFVDLLPRSVFFLLGGLFLIVWAVLVDRQRRRKLAAGGGDHA